MAVEKQQKYYAVKHGRTTGVFDNWADCQQSIKGYSGAVFKSFTTIQAAHAYMDLEESAAIEIDSSLPFAYIDGSFSKTHQRYGYGGFISANGTIEIVQGTGNSPDFLSYRNITGEVRGAIEIMRRAVLAGYPAIVLYFDYAGIQQWAEGTWKASTPLAAYYSAYYHSCADRLKVYFVHVNGHTGIAGNQIADLLAKQAVGAKITKKQAQMLEDFRRSGLHDCSK